MVLGVTHFLPKTQPSTSRQASPAKLRLAFEAAPFGRLVEMAGGKTSDGVSGNSVLDMNLRHVMFGWVGWTMVT